MLIFFEIKASGAYFEQPADEVVIPAKDLSLLLVRLLLSLLARVRDRIECWAGCGASNIFLKNHSKVIFPMISCIGIKWGLQSL